MDAVDWTEVEAIFGSAHELPPAERIALLDARCAGRAGLRAEVESLLASHDRAGEFLNAHAASALADAPATHDLSGRLMGPFRLIEPIGHGGMGVVYRAERVTSEFTQVAAVKVIDAPLQSAEMLRHFRTERQILAGLRHPSIVTLLDGGVGDAGYAFLAMEYIDGVAITDHVAKGRLLLEDRVRLVQRVCGAVQYAHQHGVVHRDLKPANILVTPDGVPKVLDFGVAKLLSPAPASPADTATSPWRLPLTPNYASPEQLRGLPVTTACDIYALGVLLYELLSGVRPYDTAGLPLDEVLRIVSNVDPRRPSTAAAEDLPYRARVLRGDLDAIVLKAMSKDPARRYSSAQELSEDLGRSLTRQPVIAREPSLGYVIAKAAERHRAAFAAAGISLLALVVALSVSLWERHLAVVERNRATARFNDVRQIADAMIFKFDNAVQALPGSTPLRQQIVAEGLGYLEKLMSDPQRDDALNFEIARAYHRIGDVQGNPTVANLGDREAARVSYRKAVALLHPLTGSPAVGHDAAIELGRTEITLANLANIVGDRTEAAAALADATRVADAAAHRFPHDDEARRLGASVAFQMAILARREPDELAAWQRAAAMFRSLLDEKPDDPDRQRNVALTEKYIGGYFETQSDYASALAHHQRAQALDEKRVAAQPSDRMAQIDAAIDLANVAYSEWKTGHLPDAAATYEQSLEIRTRLASSDPNDVLARTRLAYVHSKLGEVYREMRQIDKALTHSREAARLGESLAGIDPQLTDLFADDLEALGNAEAAAGHQVAACHAYRRAFELWTTLAANRGLDAGMAKSVAFSLNQAKEAVARCPPAPPLHR
jgi:non-specific serine/threonine protein kinase/serine/threonine-protein kinase